MSTKKVIVLAIGGSALLFALIVALIWLGFRSTGRMVGNARSCADTFIACLRSHDYPGAYLLLTPETRAGHSAKEIRSVQARVESANASVITSVEDKNSYINYYNGITTVRFVYKINFVQTEVPLYMIIKKDHGRWYVQAFQYYRPPPERHHVNG